MPMKNSYRASRWYWFVDGDMTQVFSSEQQMIVPTDNPAYRLWLAEGNVATRIASYSELYQVLLAANALTQTILGVLAAQPNLDPRVMVEILLSVGVTISSTGTPELNGTYAIDVTSQNRYSAIAAGIASGKGVPGGGSTFGMLSLDGAAHTFDGPNFLNFSNALEDYIYHVYATEAVIIAGGSAVWPSRTLAIA